jgi:DNA polymerase V
VYRIGFNYSKAEVILLNLCQQGNSPRICLLGRSGEATKVLSVLDAINDRCGRGTLRVASVLTTPDWVMRRQLMSQSYTTRLDQIWRVPCR